MIPTFALLHEVDEALRISDVVQQYIGFLAYFFSFGALGFHFFVLGRVKGDAATESSVLEDAEHRAALAGALGAVLLLATYATSLAGSASDAGVSFLSALTGSPIRDLVTPLVGIVWLFAFPIARARVSAAWNVAAVAGAVLVLQSIVTGKWTSLINPIHKVSASLWLGTLLMLVAAGLPAVFRADLTSERRNALTAELIAHFSPLALVAASVLAITGLTTAILHLKFVAALWTTSYGITLDIKLLFVALVLAMGAYNWKRMTPKIGTDEGARAIHRSAQQELTVAAIVLAITAVLVSLPSPKLPH